MRKNRGKGNKYGSFGTVTPNRETTNNKGKTREKKDRRRRGKKKVTCRGDGLVAVSKPKTGQGYVPGGRTKGEKTPKDKVGNRNEKGGWWRKTRGLGKKTFMRPQRQRRKTRGNAKARGGSLRQEEKGESKD